MSKTSGHTRNQSFLGGSSHAERTTGHLFESFVLIGAATHESTDATTLFCHPEGADPIPALASFCFNEGLHVRRLPRSNSMSAVNEVRFNMLSRLEDTQHSYVVLLTGADHVLYCVCVEHEELLDDTPCVLGGDQRAAPAGDDEAVFASAPRVYCLISRFPFFKLHFDFIYTWLAKDRQLRLQEAGPAGLIALLDGYMNVQIPDGGTSLSFKLPGDVHAFNFVLPSTDQDVLLSQWCVACVFKSLSIDVILTILTCALCECRIIIEEEDRGILSAIVLGLIPLLKPFIWQGPLVPILPVSMSPVLDAPVPYIVGVQHWAPFESVMEEPLDSSVLRVTVCNNEAVGGAAVRMPHQKALEVRLKLLAKRLAQPPVTAKTHERNPSNRGLILNPIAVPNKSYLNPYKMTEVDSEAGHALMLECIRHNDSLFEETLLLHDTDWHTKKSVGELLEIIKKPSRPFFRMLFDTQMWYGRVAAIEEAEERKLKADADALREINKRRATVGVREKYEKMITSEEQTISALKTQIADLNRKLLMAEERIDAFKSSKQLYLQRRVITK